MNRGINSIRELRCKIRKNATNFIILLRWIKDEKIISIVNWLKSEAPPFLLGVYSSIYLINNFARRKNILFLIVFSMYNVIYGVFLARARSLHASWIKTGNENAEKWYFTGAKTREIEQRIKWYDAQHISGCTACKAISKGLFETWRERGQPFVKYWRLTSSGDVLRYFDDVARQPRSYMP